jgi:hypothetical protein
VFILYAVVIGLVAGFALGGRVSGLANVRFHWPWIVFGALLVQIILFSDFVAARIGDIGPAIYVASSATALAVVLRNWRIPGLALVALGAISNLAAIVANGGYMPASNAAMAALGKGEPAVYSNSAVLQRPLLEPLTDIFALPGWLPLANIFSIGDVLIGIGVVVAITLAMRPSPAPAQSASA